MKVRHSAGGSFNKVNDLIKGHGLATVCESASCPNRGECFSCGTATFMIMGDVCSRNCKFCGVNNGKLLPLDGTEPDRLAEVVKELGLKHVVITSVTRDDLPDGGARHFAECINKVKQLSMKPVVEVLTPDFNYDTDSLDIVAGAEPDIFNHNVETTRELTRMIRNNASYDRSLQVLKYMSDKKQDWVVKSGIMVGLGESFDELIATIEDIHAAGASMLTIGQYLRPSKQNICVEKYYHPDEFDELKQIAERIGFKHVASGPFVRSSYHAEGHFNQKKK